MDDDHARLRRALRRFDPQWLPDARYGRGPAPSGPELTARLDGLLEFWRREHADIRAHVRSHLDSDRTLDNAVLAAMRTLCRRPPPTRHRWAALHAALRRSTSGRGPDPTFSRPPWSPRRERLDDEEDTWRS